MECMWRSKGEDIRRKHHQKSRSRRQEASQKSRIRSFLSIQLKMTLKTNFRLQTVMTPILPVNNESISNFARSATSFCCFKGLRNCCVLSLLWHEGVSWRCASIVTSAQLQAMQSYGSAIVHYYPPTTRQ